MSVIHVHFLKTYLSHAHLLSRRVFAVILRRSLICPVPCVFRPLGLVSFGLISVVHMFVLVPAQLLRIEEELGSKAVYAGKNFRAPSWMA